MAKHYTYHFIDKEVGVLGELEATEPIYIGCKVVYNGTLYEVVDGNAVAVYLQPLRSVIQLHKTK